MSDYVTLYCPSCGGNLEITSDMDRFACAHCGVEHVVKRAGGLVSLAPLVAELQEVRTGVDKTTSELALPDLNAELAALEEEKRQLASTVPAGFNWRTVLGQFVLAVLIVVVTSQGVPATDSGTNWVAAFIVGAVVFFLLFLIHLYRYHRASLEEARRIQEDTAGLDEQIRLKQEEIARHREIAPVRIRVRRTTSELMAISRLEWEIAELEGKRSRSSKKINIYWLVAISIGVIACVISAVLVVAESELFMVSLIGGAALCAQFVFLGISRNNKLARAVGQEIDRKQAELDKYKEIVSRGG
jgi:hypothetical protein